MAERRLRRRRLNIIWGVLLAWGTLTGCRTGLSQIETKIQIRPRNEINIKIRKGAKRLKIKIHMQWRTKNTYVDIDTGEELDRIQIQKGKYITIHKEIKHTKQSSYHGTKHIIHKCRRNNQTGLF